MGRMPDFEAWAIFARVAELRSFASAARSLGLSAATVSKAVSRLERSVGTTLLHRNTRNLSLTAEGRELLVRASTLLSDGEALEDWAREGSISPRGHVRIAAPMTFGIGSVAPLLPAVFDALPGVTIDLQLNDAEVDLVGEGFDIGVRIGRPRDSELLARKVGDIANVIVAAPSYIERYGAPQTPDDLAHHRCISYIHRPPPERWHLIDERGSEVRVTVETLLTSNNGDAMMPPLLAGQGVAVMAEFAVRQALENGTLEVILPGWRQPHSSLYLITPSSGPRPAKVSAVLDLLFNGLTKAIG